MNVTEEKGWEVKSESAGVHTDHRLSVIRPIRYSQTHVMGSFAFTMIY